MQFIQEFLKHNNSIEEFRKLSLEPGSMSWSGSAVPAYQRKMDFWESLLPLCNTASLLEHKLYIEQIIQGIQKSIEREKKRDFVGTDW